MNARLLIIATAALLCAAPAAAQRPAAADTGNAAEPQLVFDREVFNYPAGGRRDPFQPLTASEDGPLFEELTLRMIVFARDPRESLVLVQDISEKIHRLRRGDRVGNATVVDIGRTRVLFSVNEFGVYRQGVLDLKPTQGASR
ncbi:MAG: hypothetical protein ACRELX_11410 [Longimicrobiales bacterium]